MVAVTEKPWREYSSTLRGSEVSSVQRGAEAPPPCRGVNSEGRELPRLGRPRRQLGGEEDVETVAQQVGDPCLRRVRRGGGMRAEQGGRPVQVLTHENDATAQGVLEVDRLQLLEPLGMVVLGDRPPCPRVVVEGRGESARSGGQVGGAGIAERVRHAGTVVQLVRGADGRCVHDDSRIRARSTSNSQPGASGSKPCSSSQRAPRRCVTPAGRYETVPSTKFGMSKLIDRRGEEVCAWCMEGDW